MFEFAIDVLQREIENLEAAFKNTAEIYGYNNVTVEEEDKDRDVEELKNAIEKLRDAEINARS